MNRSSVMSCLLVFSTGLFGACSDDSGAGAGPAGGSPGMGGSAGEGGGGGATVTVEDACAEYAVAWCGLRDVCTEGHFIAVHYDDVEACNSAQTAQCIHRANAPDSSVSPEFLASCADALVGFECDAFENATLPVACVPTGGTRSDGEPCAFGAQCLSGYCSSAATEACGVCAPKPTEGADCAGETGCGVGSGMVCDPLTSQCVAPGDVGASCDTPAQCRFGASCVGATGSSSGVCEPAGAVVGAACDAQALLQPDCERGLGLRCVDGLCEKVAYAGAGEACGQLDTGVSVCAANGDCAGPAGAKSCVAAAAVGDACDTQAGPPCAAPADCIVTASGTMGTCALTGMSSCE